MTDEPGAMIPVDYPGQIIVEPPKQTTTDIVNEAVGSNHPPALVAAMAALLPPDLRSPVDIIALGIRAKKSGLDPFTEIHAWKNERGKLQFQISRDGFIYIAGIDPNVESLEFQHVYEGEDFAWEKGGDGKITVAHTGGLVTGALLGAYCVAHMSEGKADHLEMRVVENYRHLMKKANWQYLPEMLITRVIGACVRLVCPDRAGGLYSEADMQLPEVGAVREVVVKRAKKATVEKIEGLVESAKPSTIHGPIVIKAEPAIGPRYQCGVCEKSFKTQQGLAGHMRAHKPKEPAPDPTKDSSPPMDSDPSTDASAAGSESEHNGTAVPFTGDVEIEVPDGYQVHLNGALYEVTGPMGERVEGAYYTFADAALAAQNALNALQDDYTPLKLADIYAWCRTHKVPAPAVGDVINDSIHSDEFEQFREDGAQNISAFNLDADARGTLLEILKQEYSRV